MSFSLGRLWVTVGLAFGWSAPAFAAQLDINWFHYEHPASCEAPERAVGAETFFDVNGVPIPIGNESDRTGNLPGDSVRFHSYFDSTLLRVGDNKIDFAVTADSGNNSCVISAEIVDLMSPFTSPIRLFDVGRVGSKFDGSTSMKLGLSQIDPQLARDIEAFLKAITQAIADLEANAAQDADLMKKLDAYKSLAAELDGLTSRDLDQITVGDIDDIWNRYGNAVDSGVRAALEAELADLRANIADLQKQVTELINDFGRSADDVAALATQLAQNSGFDPSNAGNYSGLNSDSIGEVDIPDLSDPNAPFDPLSNGYSAYADRIISQLNATIVDGKVSLRGEFASIVQGWRRSQKAMEKAIRSRPGVATKELGAFLTAESRVSTLVGRYMDRTDWFIDSPVSQALRQLLDGVINDKFPDLARALRARLLEWKGTTPTPPEKLFDATLTGIGNGMLTLDFDVDKYDTRAATLAAINDALAFARSIVDGAYSFVPGLGTFNSMCEAITGWEGCNDAARIQLPPFARIAAGIGAVIGSAGFWKGAVEAAEVGPRIAAVADKAGLLALADRLALRSKVGAAAIASFEKAADSSFIAFGKAALGQENALLKESTTSLISADSLNQTLKASSLEPGWVAATQAVKGTSKGGQVVRVYRAGGKSLPTGRWLIPVDEIAGLSPTQIQQKFSLPETPNRIVDVLFGDGEDIVIGVAGPNKFGPGGGLQIQWLREPIDWGKYASWFTNDRAI